MHTKKVLQDSELSSTIGYIKQLLYTLGWNNKPETEIKINFLVCVQISISAMSFSATM